MNARPKKQIDPMREGHPEPFPMPRTIPTGWDLSDFFSAGKLPRAEVNGTAYDKLTGTKHDPNDDTQNPV
jgi:hypothetical protein